MARHPFMWTAILAAAAMAPAARCADKPNVRTFHLQWRDLDRATRGYRIALELPSGIKLQGDVLAFESDELALDVRKTSNKNAYPKGRAIIPRPEVTRLRVIKTRRMWRAAGTGIGAGIGTVLAFPITQVARNNGDSGALAALLTVGVPAGLGYLFGWAADINVVEIVVEPDR